MPRRRRVTALVVILALLHTLGLGSGVLRAAGPGEDCAASMTQGSGMGDMSMAMPAHASVASTSAPEGLGHESHPPCELPWAPRGCASAAACLPVLVPAQRDDRAEQRVVHAAVPAADVSTPASPARAPELPPPRA